MNLSNKLTFCILSLFLLAFAALPVLAQDIKATWSTDRNADNTADDPGWIVTVGGLADITGIAVTAVIPDGDALDAGDIVVTQPTDAADKDATATIAATLGTVVSVRVAVTLPETEAAVFQRVTFPAAATGAKVGMGTDKADPIVLTLIPKLKKPAISTYYVNFANNTTTVTFEFADAVTGTNGAASAPLHISDVTLDNTNAASLQIVSISGTNTVTLRSILASTIASAITTVSLNAAYAIDDTTTPVGQVMVHYDNIAPSADIPDEEPVRPVTLSDAFQAPEIDENTQWDEDFYLKVIVTDDADVAADGAITISTADGSGPALTKANVAVDDTKLTVVQVGVNKDQTATNDDNEDQTDYLIHLRPKADRVTTAGEEVTITITPIDKAGNTGTPIEHTIKLAATNAAPTAVGTIAAQTLTVGGAAVTVNVASNFNDTATDTLTYTAVSGTPATATVSVTGSVVTITAVAAGSSTITVTATDTASQTATQTIAVTVNAANAAPTAGDAIAAQTVKVGAAAVTVDVASNFSDTDALTYTAVSGTPAAATVSVAGSVVTITAVAAGSSTITVTATDTASQTATQTIAVTVSAADFVSQNPTDPDNISDVIEIPENSYVVVVRNKARANELSAALNFPTVDGEAVEIREWAKMPDLEALFNRASYGQGGALVVRKSADARDNDAFDAAGVSTSEYATPTLGSVGISEIMWALDLGQVNRDTWKVGQWIELHNLNSKKVKVLLYAQTARELVSNQLVGNTAAGDSIVGSLGGNVLDVVQNIHNNGDRTQVGWDLPGKSGNSITGENLVGAHRILPDKQGAYTAAQNYTKRDGRNKDHWQAATNVYASRELSRENNQVTTIVVADYLGTPGNRNNFTGVTLLKPDGRTGVPANRIVINEVANRSNANKAYEWIELRNVSDGTVNLKNYKISAVTAVDTDTEIIGFGGDLNVPAGGILLVLASDPVYNRAHPIHIGTGVQHTVQTFKNNGIPDGGNAVLILRGKADNGGVGTGNADNILDIAGYHSDLSKNEYTNKISSTKLWPLKNFEAPNIGQNKFDTDTVHYRQHVSGAANASGVGSIHTDRKGDQIAFQEVGYTGVGYKRLSATIAAHGGTPGYPNNAYQADGATVQSSVYISEIMYADNKAGVLPQWIELRNTSKSVGVNLHDARLTITNHADTADGDWKGKGAASVLLRNMRIKPNSAVLIASRRAVQRLEVSTVHMPSTDIFILWNVDKGAFGMTSANDDVINSHGFKILLEAKVGNAWQTLDVASNLDSDAKDSRGRSDERFAAPLWTWPTATQDETGYRISVVRNAWRKTPTSDMTIANGTKKWSWELSTEDPGHSRVAAITYYGDITDISTPGLTHGQPLPVNLSFFRPTLEDGKVVVRWTTESELDNAGFNILRSDSRHGEFKQVNAQLIQGKGTTAERSTYKWVDTSAKPGAVYYYQIEDVSFAGERSTLTTTKLKGLISAKNKLTTKWGELKGVQ